MNPPERPPTHLPPKAVQGRHTCLLIEQSSLREGGWGARGGVRGGAAADGMARSFAEVMNSLLATGDLPDIFEPHEMESILGGAKSGGAHQIHHDTNHGGAHQIHHDTHHGGCDEHQLTPSPSLRDRFSARARQYLRVAFILDPTSAELEANPQMRRRCEILRFANWSEDSMRTFGDKVVWSQMDKLELPEACGALVTRATALHRSSSAPPREFETLCVAWRQIYTERRRRTAQKLQRLERGLATLSAAESEVTKLEERTAAQQSQLVEKQSQADGAMDAIRGAMEGAFARRAEVETLRERLSGEGQEAERRKGEVEAQLAAIAPTLESARAAVGGITAQSLTEMRSLKEKHPNTPFSHMWRPHFSHMSKNNVFFLPRSRRRRSPSEMCSRA